MSRDQDVLEAALRQRLTELVAEPLIVERLKIIERVAGLGADLLRIRWPAATAPATSDAQADASGVQEHRFEHESFGIERGQIWQAKALGGWKPRRFAVVDISDNGRIFVRPEVVQTVEDQHGEWYDIEYFRAAFSPTFTR